MTSSPIRPEIYAKAERIENSYAIKSFPMKQTHAAKHMVPLMNWCRKCATSPVKRVC